MPRAIPLTTVNPKDAKPRARSRATLPSIFTGAARADDRNRFVVVGKNISLDVKQRRRIGDRAQPRRIIRIGKRDNRYPSIARALDFFVDLRPIRKGDDPVDRIAVQSFDLFQLGQCGRKCRRRINEPRREFFETHGAESFDSRER